MTDTAIGVISDTHGYLDPAVCGLFAGVDLIIHAGDIVDPAILTALESVAPVVAVAGNVEAGGLAERLPREVVGEVGGMRYVVCHKRKRLLKRLAAGRIGVDSDGVGPDLVVYGHVPSSVWVDGTLYLNPGSATAPDEEDDDPTVAIVVVESTGLSVRFIPLERKHVEEAVARPGAARGKPPQGGSEES